MHQRIGNTAVPNFGRALQPFKRFASTRTPTFMVHGKNAHLLTRTLKYITKSLRCANILLGHETRAYELSGATLGLLGGDGVDIHPQLAKGRASGLPPEKRQT
jgi:hypothetical protein